jgi:aminoglycoside phosphotransferase (APT) family kinase protein
MQEAFEPDLEGLAAAIERTFPDLRQEGSLSLLGRGFRSMAVETAGGVVLKIGRLPEAADDYAAEWRIRRFVANHLSDILPGPRWYAEPGADFPYGALGYRKLSGETPAWGIDPGAAFARDLGAFMARLHRLPVDEARAEGLSEVDSYGRLLEARDVVMPALAAGLTAEAFSRIEEWWTVFAADDRMRSPRVTVCHHDLWHDNLLRSEAGGLSGVLDIAHIELGDPAHDFPAPRYFGGAFMAELLSAYLASGGQFDGDDYYRAKRFYEGREFGGLAWAIEHDDERETKDAIEKIVQGPILSGQQFLPEDS